jgi:NADPH-dependent curcumin reductase CurA
MTMSETNLQVLLAARPEGVPKESDFDVVEVPVTEPGEGEVLVRQRFLSLDPAMRGWMSDRKSYIPPVALGEVMRGFGVGEVVASGDAAFAPGDVVAGTLGWQRFALIEGRHLDKAPPGLEPRLLLGPLGMAGVTAHYGLLEIGQPKEGETVLISGGAGAVGSMVGQIAKIKGCRAVGIAGTDEKCAWLTDELGFDGAINYKTAGNLLAEIGRTCPDGVDIFFDNVGGQILDTSLAAINVGARVVICGAISTYNDTEPPPGPRNYIHLLVKRARMEGFIILDHRDRYQAMALELAGWLMAGKLRHREHVVTGLENAPAALNMLWDGSNEGKLMIEVV